MHDMMFIGIQYGSVMFYSSLRFGVDWALVLVCWHFVLFIVFFITFVYKSLSVFFPLYLFGLVLRLYCLKNGRILGCQAEGMEASYLFVEERKVEEKV